jgi:hypothetical protein
MEILESAAYIALGFYSDIRSIRKSIQIGNENKKKKRDRRKGHLTNNKVTIANCFQEINKMDKANVSIRKYFSKQTLSGISSHIAAKNLILRHHKLRLNISVKRMMIELLAYSITNFFNKCNFR